MALGIDCVDKAVIVFGRSEVCRLRLSSDICDLRGFVYKLCVDVFILVASSE